MEKWLPLPEQVLAKRLCATRLERGESEGYEVSEHGILLRIRGHMYDEMILQFCAVADEYVARTDNLSVFGDWDLTTSYDSAARNSTTRWFKDNRASTDRIYVCTRNRLVAMGTQVGAMALSMVGLHVKVVSRDEMCEQLMLGLSSSGR